MQTIILKVITFIYISWLKAAPSLYFSLGSNKANTHDNGVFNFANFNSYHLLNISQSIDSITNVTMTPIVQRISDFAFDLNSDLIEVDFSGVSYESRDNLILDIEFAGDAGEDV